MNYAFVVGLDSYDNPGSSLSGAVADAVVFAAWLLSSGEIEPGNMSLILANDSDLPAMSAELLEAIVAAPSPQTRLGGYTHMRHALAAFRDSIAGPVGRCYFYFAGHGLRSDNLAHDGDAICCADFSEFAQTNSMTTTSIEKWFSCIAAEEQFFIYDACRSLAVNRKGEFGTADQEGTPASKLPRQYMFMATAAGATALENPEGGAFTRHLLAGLAGKGNAKTWVHNRAEYIVYWDSLCRFVAGATGQYFRENLPGEIAALPDAERERWIEAHTPQALGRVETQSVELARISEDAVPPVSLIASIVPASVAGAELQAISGFANRAQPFADGRSVLSLQPRSYMLRAQAPSSTFDPAENTIDLYDDSDSILFSARPAVHAAISAVETATIRPERIEAVDERAGIAGAVAGTILADVKVATSEMVWLDSGPASDGTMANAAPPAFRERRMIVRHADLPGSAAAAFDAIAVHDPADTLGHAELSRDVMLNAGTSDALISVGNIVNIAEQEHVKILFDVTHRSRNPAVDAVDVDGGSDWIRRVTASPALLMCPDAQVRLDWIPANGGEHQSGWGTIAMGTMDDVVRIEATHPETGNAGRLVSPGNVAGNLIVALPPPAADPPDARAAAWVNGHVEDGVLYARRSDGADFAMAAANLASVVHLADVDEIARAAPSDDTGLLTVTAIKQRGSPDAVRRESWQQSRLWRQGIKNLPIINEFKPVADDVPQLYRWSDDVRPGSHWLEYRDADRRRMAGFKMPLETRPGYRTHIMVHERADHRTIIYAHILRCGEVVPARVLRGIMHIQRASAAGWNGIDDPASQSLLAGEWFEPVSAAILCWIADGLVGDDDAQTAAAIDALVDRLCTHPAGLVDGQIIAASRAFARGDVTAGRATLAEAIERKSCPLLDRSLRAAVSLANHQKLFSAGQRWLEKKLKQSVGHSLWMLRKEDDKKSQRQRHLPG